MLTGVTAGCWYTTTDDRRQALTRTHRTRNNIPCNRSMFTGLRCLSCSLS